MTDLPVPKFRKGQTVWYPYLTQTAKRFPCPDCNDTKVWKITTPAGDTLEAACGRCGGGSYSGLPRIPSLVYYEKTPQMEILTIGSITAESDTSFGEGPRVRYMCFETGVGSGCVYDEKELYGTVEEAVAAGLSMAGAANLELAEKPQRLREVKFSALLIKDAAFKNAEQLSWDACWAYRRLREDLQTLADDDRTPKSIAGALKDMADREDNHRFVPVPELLKACERLLNEADAGLTIHWDTFRDAVERAGKP